MNDKVKINYKKNNIIKLKNNSRSLSRLISLQILFADDFFKNHKNLNDIKQELIDNYIIHEDYEFIDLTDKIDEKFIDKLIIGVKENIEEFDQKISSLLQAKYNISLIDNIELQIFRLAIYELKFFNEIPTNVIMNEYVDIAGSFFIEKKINFINGLINALSKDMRKA